MKRIIFILLMITGIAYGQRYQVMPQPGYGPVKRMLIDSVLTIPTNVTGGSNITDGRDVGKIRYNIPDSSLQAWTGYQWRSPAGGGSGSNIIYDLPIVKIVDTVSIPPADDSNDGYLVAADYTSFRKKWGHNGNLAALNDWLGTTNTEPMIIKTNNSEVMRISGDGNYRYSLSPNTNSQTGTYNLVFGYQSSISNNYSFSGGFQTNASGLASVALNRNTTASGNYSFACGSSSIATGTYSAAFNVGQSTAYGGTSFGTYNEIATDPSLPTSFDYANRIFQIGNGTGTGARSNAFTMLTSGNTGWKSILIPTATIHLPAGTTTASTAPIKFTAGTNLTAAEAGAMEWDGTNLFISQTTGPTRKTIAYTDDITVTASSTTTFTNKNIQLTIVTKTASDTLELTDAGKDIEMNVGSANNLSIPANADVAFPVGTQIVITQLGAGQTTIVALSGVTIRSSGGKLKITDQYSGATLIKRGTNEWVLFGNLSL